MTDAGTWTLVYLWLTCFDPVLGTVAVVLGVRLWLRRRRG